MPLIADISVVKALQAEWTGVELMRDRMKHLLLATFAGGSFTAPALSSVVYNLPLLLAFDVLRQVLIAARDEGRFISRRGQLGDLMDNAKSHLSWNDWDSLREGVRRRNEVAHDGKLFDAAQCLEEIKAIEIQLKAWGL